MTKKIAFVTGWHGKPRYSRLPATGASEEAGYANGADFSLINGGLHMS
ncbi:hypothetical protein [Pseudomonas fluorescens]|uniref:Uncharacterized protein n=1 Tax=Pseudomonas fluorescens TaxID=294 RepID=A0A5E7ERM4_PSEFL|nr:hypothetical protein [Pseudomonas fluorescens]VVO29488.1 hypothetical protein PS710_04907 [Pseudomonas fluorescens]